MNNNQCVYFVKHNNLNPIKIGRTKSDNPIKRLKGFSIFSPYGFQIIGFIQTNNSVGMELFFHEKYKKNRLNGEWFNIPIDVIKNEILQNEFGVLIFNINNENNKNNILKSEIIKLKNSGHNVTQISNKLKVSRQYIYKVLNKNNK